MKLGYEEDITDSYIPIADLVTFSTNTFTVGNCSHAKVTHIVLQTLIRIILINFI